MLFGRSPCLFAVSSESVETNYTNWFKYINIEKIKYKTIILY